ncbi:hypothetical protein MRB53_032246 [Persea americana]|uniref:Uncharacterized protein n=1 Tax=Persea americana TaxID=3435 RepID=A0ACC2KRE8_PERAE|nr:hypothetical protein MRB53_032246 [Persea americana]
MSSNEENGEMAMAALGTAAGCLLAAGWRLAMMEYWVFGRRVLGSTWSGVNGREGECRLGCGAMVLGYEDREEEREAAGSCVFCRHSPAPFIAIHHRILHHRNRRRSVACARTAPPLQKRKATPGYRTGEEDYRIAANPVLSLLLRLSLRHLRP